MSDEAAKPPEYPTVNLEKVPAWAISLTEDVKGTRDEVRAARVDISLVSNDVSLVKERLALVESRTTSLEGRADGNSLRARGQSEVDVTHDAAISNILVTVDQIAKKQDVLDTKQDLQTKLMTDLRDVAAKVSNDPKVKYVAAAIWTALIAWLARKGISVQ